MNHSRSRWGSSRRFDAAQARLIANVTGHLAQDVSGPMRDRVFAYWRNVDKNVGDAVAANFDS